MSQSNGIAVKATRRRAGFSMIELVIVVVIIGIIAAIAIPRMSRGAAAANDSACAQNLAIIRNALELYYAEHDNEYPDPTTVVDQLTKYTKIDGTDANDAKDAATGRIYGPYLRKIPPLTVGTTRKGDSGMATADGAGVGWLYNPATDPQLVKPNVPAGTEDGRGVLYSSY